MSEVDSGGVTRGDVDGTPGPRWGGAALRALWRRGNQPAGQAGILFVLVGLIGVPNDLVPGSIGSGQPISLVIDVSCLLIGWLCFALPWDHWDERATLVLPVLAVADIAWANTVTVGMGPTYSLYFVAVFAWIGAWHARGTALAFAPIAVMAYVSPVLAGAVVPAGTLASMPEVIPVAVLIAEAMAHKVALARRGSRELHHRAIHDTLTGLPNRVQIVARIQRARAGGRPVTVLLIDLDNFKDINDTFGHRRGDELLQAVAGRLSQLVDHSDRLGRLGGDEFVVVIEDAGGPDAVAGAARELLDALGAPYLLADLDGVPLIVRASIGIATSSEETAEDMLRNADVALHEAKRSGKGGAVTFCPEMQQAVQARLELEMDLRTALDEDQLFLEYQPIFELATMTPTGVEALVRWRHATRGRIPPDVFIPIAEEGPLIVRIGRWVLLESCRQAARWAADGLVVPVSVNVSGRQLDSEDFPATVAQVLAETGLDPNLLTLELTETVLMRTAERTVERLNEVRSLGVKLAIDDFGTGYSSLTYLHRFPVDILKIDRSFIAGLARADDARSFLRALVQLGKSFSLTVVAEGIEDEHQVAELRAAACDRGQGYLYARPGPPAAIKAVWARHRRTVPAADPTAPSPAPEGTGAGAAEPDVTQPVGASS